MKPSSGPVRRSLDKGGNLKPLPYPSFAKATAGRHGSTE